MAVVAFIEPPQDEVVEKILRGHQSGADQRRPKLRLCARSVPVGGMWEGPIRTLANQRGPPSNSERDPDEPRELQLVLDPEFL